MDDIIFSVGPGPAGGTGKRIGGIPMNWNIVLNVVLVILVILVVALVVLYFLGRRL